MREKIIDKFVRQHGWTKGVELGVWKGRTFKYLLMNNNNLTLTGVDLYQAQPDNDGPEKWLPGENGHEWDHMIYYNDLTNFCKDTNGRGKILRTSTLDALSHFEDNSIDFVFIDADHSYESCKLDIENWYHKVRKGGYIIGHDIDWHSVKRAVTEFFHDNYIIEKDNVWWSEKT